MVLTRKIAASGPERPFDFRMPWLNKVKVAERGMLFPDFISGSSLFRKCKLAYYLTQNDVPMIPLKQRAFFFPLQRKSMMLPFGHMHFDGLVGPCLRATLLLLDDYTVELDLQF